MTRHRVVILLLTVTLLASDRLFAFETSSLEGTTSSISNGFTAGNHPAGSHFHSSNLPELPADNPPINLSGVAEVGGFFGEEEIRAVSEFDVQDPASKAELFFEVLDLFKEGLVFDERGVDGLFNQGPFEGTIEVVAYTADHTESLTDYEIAPISDVPILSVEVTPLVVGGDVFSADVTSLYNELANSGEDLGIRFQMREPDVDAGAITFTNIRLQLETVPEPSSRSLVLLGLGLLPLLRARS